MPIVSAPRELRLAQASERERRRAAGRHRDEHVGGADAILSNDPGALLGPILGPFDGLDESALAAGQQEQDALLRPAEGRGQLGAVLSGEPTRRAGAHIDKAAAVAQTRLGGERRPLDGAARGAHRRHRRELPLDHRLQDVGGVPRVDVGIARTDDLCAHRPLKLVNPSITETSAPHVRSASMVSPS